MRKLKLGIIGVGNIGSKHYGHVLDGKCPDIEITAIADRREARRDWAMEKYAEAKAKGYSADAPAVFTEGDDLVASGLCEAVLIAVPHYFHPHFAIEAFKHGQHVMCEKPAGVYTLQVREMTPIE